MAAIKYLSADDYAAVGAQIVLGNTYHLMLRPGADTVAHFGGLGRFAGWDGLTLTDSGGFQVFSLEPKVDDDGVTFQSTYDGSSHRFTPETAVAIQQLLGADIQMVLDVCPPLPSADEVDPARGRADRGVGGARPAPPTPDPTRRCSASSRAGSTRRCARRARARVADLEFDGYGIGGLSVGETREQMLPALAAALAELPTDRPRYLMGVGDPAAMVEAVSLGVDQFDCVMQTRLGRHGTALTTAGRLNVKRREFALSDAALDPECPCSVCARHSLGLPAASLQGRRADGVAAGRIHNVAWTIDLMNRMRAAIQSGTIAAFREQILAVWA